ncbi:pimeloyl-ACP methyl ester carboxylesterase [Nitrospirillum amazonense]|uniref:Pimeloyl-ACP methyl ester carboxylesterase n=1 Tax=Nitrospirillum amazonense TaxID=28077 RepID=A0A560JDB0_9PROT|nr:alpha/beta hydrolase [Nitrospirillum amazonense]TWB69188.1 pimeloyl-ACP methyl ester carboxylesterase [Nitrospirillum amazonense]
MKKLFAAAVTVALLTAGVAAAETIAKPPKPTIVLVHGAFADASSWNGVIRTLEKDGYPVVAAANPLRGVKSDAAAVADVVASIPGPVVLVGHSYGGSVISEAANGKANVQSLVFVAAFAPEAGETAAGLSGKFPGSTLAPTLAPAVTLSDGGKDLYIQQERFPDQFAADVPAAEAKLMAATQRPIAQAALGEASGEGAWHRVPSWFVYGDQDRNIPPQALAFMAERAHSHGTVVVKGGSHVVMVSHPGTVAALIEKAAASPAP